MNYTITKLDHRHSWHQSFKWMIEFKKSRSYSTLNTAGVLAFDRSRRWFNEKFGWSQDVKTRATISRISPAEPGDYNEIWAYSVEYDEYRLYVKDDATLNWFVLSHPKDNHGQ